MGVENFAGVANWGQGVSNLAFSPSERYSVSLVGEEAVVPLSFWYRLQKKK